MHAYSLGTRQRLGLAGALVRRLELLVLDEPANGLDPQGIREIRELLLELNREGTTVFLSSHLLAEIEQMCTRVGVLHRGRLVLQDRLMDLRGETGRVEVTTPDADLAARLLHAGRDGTALEDRAGQRLLVRSADPVALTRALVEGWVRVTSLVAQRRTLEQVVLGATTANAEVPA